MASAVPSARSSAGVWFAGLFAVCLAAAWLTNLLTTLTGPGVSLWLPPGFLLVAAFVSSLRRWPVLALATAGAEAAANIVWYGHDWGPAAMFISGNVLSGLIGAALLLRTIGDRGVFASLRNATVFVAVAVLVMPVISASFVSTALGWSYGQSWLTAWPRIYLGDSVGTMIGAPLMLLIFGRASPRLRWTNAKIAEVAALTAFLALAAALSLSGLYPFVFLMLLPVLWAALRFQSTGGILVAVAIAVLACYLTALGISPFGPSALYGERGSEALQLFMLVLAGTAILIGAMAEQYRAAYIQLQRRNRDLAARDIELASDLAESETRLRETATLLGAIGEACPDVIFAKNRDGHLVYANGATLDVLGIDRRLAGNALDLTQVLADSEAKLIKQNDDYVLSTGKTLFAEEIVTTPLGPRIFRAAKAPIRNAAGEITGLAGVCIDITDSKKAAERERILMHEIEHRSRNLLAVLQSIVQLIEAENVSELREAITRRLHALARSNNLIAAANWSGASLSAILKDEIAPYLDHDDPRLSLDGPDVMFDAALTQSLSLVIHELATNAAKYGALSVPTGRLSVHWTVGAAGNGGREVTIVWQENDGPLLERPKSQGFGSTVIDLFAHERDGGRVDYDWRPEGLRVLIVQPLMDEVPAFLESRTG